MIRNKRHKKRHGWPINRSSKRPLITIYGWPTIDLTLSDNDVKIIKILQKSTRSVRHLKFVKQQRKKRKKLMMK